MSRFPVGICKHPCPLFRCIALFLDVTPLLDRFAFRPSPIKVRASAQSSEYHHTSLPHPFYHFHLKDKIPLAHIIITKHFESCLLRKDTQCESQKTDELIDEEGL